MNLIKQASKNKVFILVWAVIFAMSVFLRFFELGYSNYYGDETKTLYVNKTVTASEFLLNQRKGPVQFLAAWAMEKFSGGFNEFWIRAPFALAGFFSILAFALVVYELFDYKTSVFSTLIFALSGFNIAFSRTAQYQTFVMLFGLMGLWFYLLYLKKSNVAFVISSGLFFGLAFLSHYDAVFYFVPVLVVTFLNLKKLAILESDKLAKAKLVKAFLLMVFITVVVASLFYLPYIYKGFFATRTLGYLSRRLNGSAEYLPNSSLKTFLAYNPFILYFLLILGAFAGFLKTALFKKIQTLPIIVWFIAPFILFQFVFSNPGTHILNYFVPLYVISGYFIANTRFNVLRYFSYVVLFGQLIVCLHVYVPIFNSGYPWKTSKVYGYTLQPVSKQTNLFLYGFPYNRGWNQIANYLEKQNRVRGFYTNDNSVVASYYVPKYPLQAPGSNFLPQYYVDVSYNQEFEITPVEFLSNYKLQQEVIVNNSPAAKIYLLDAAKLPSNVK